MRKLLIFFTSAMMVSGCGTQDYADPPVPSQNTVFHSGNPPPPQYPRRDLAKPPSRDSLLEWMPLEPSTLESIRCSVGDGTTVRTYDGLTAALFGGAIVGVIAGIGGHFFLGKPVIPPGGTDPHEAESISRDSQYFWHKPVQLIRGSAQIAIQSGFAVMGCQMALTGEFIPTDGILGPDYTAFSAALVLGGASAVVVDPWVSKLFPKGNPSDKQKPTANPQQENLSSGSDAGGAGKAPPSGKTQQWKDWASASGGFVKGVWYRISPSLAVLAISGGIGYNVGVLVYDRLQDGYAAPGCYSPSSNSQKSASATDGVQNTHGSPFQESVFQ